MTKNKCKGITIPKDFPFFAISKEDVIKREGSEIFGKVLSGNKKVFAVEDAYTLTKYKDRACAKRHFESNVRINKKIKRR